jgi:O-methyltransferase domain/Dimerisation domain
MVLDEAGLMMQMLTGYLNSQIVHAAATFSLAEHLANGPASADEIAKAADTNPLATFRFLRACVALGLVKHDGESRFSTTALLNTLRKDNPRGLHGLALAFPAPGHWLPWGRLTEAIRTGRSQAVPALGMEIWDYFATQPEESAAFTEALENYSAAILEELANIIDVDATSTAADIGGASGQLLLGLLRRSSRLRGIVFDRPDVVASAMAAAKACGLEDRVTAIGGNFLESVPEADLYILKYVLCDWSDADCIRILKNCRHAMRPSGRLIVIELLIGNLDELGPVALTDLTMMVVNSGGRQRTLAEFQTLLEAADFRVARVCLTTTPASIIEATTL